jgi:hypothetical protein
VKSVSFLPQGVANLIHFTTGRLEQVLDELTSVETSWASKCADRLIHYLKSLVDKNDLEALTNLLSVVDAFARPKLGRAAMFLGQIL